MELRAGHIISTFGTLTQLYEDYIRTDGYLIVDASGEGNVKAVDFTGVIDYEFSGESSVVSVPIEKGSFAAYNKVQSPNRIRATLAIDGQGRDWILQSAIDSLDAMQQGTQLVSFITPIQEYQNYSLERFNFQRAAVNGLNVLFVEVELVEIREVEPEYTDAKAATPISSGNAKKAGSVSGQDKGQQQPQDNRSFITEGWDNIKSRWV